MPEKKLTDSANRRVSFLAARIRELTVNPELGRIVWPNVTDICTDVLYHGRSPASLERR